MRHFDAWLVRDPYSIWHYYSTGRRWQETIRDLIHTRKICAPQVDLPDPNIERDPVDPFARPMALQSDSMFFKKLPLEIRLLIYRYVFGSETVHLVQLKGKIRHVRCHGAGSSLDNHRSCCPVTTARWRIFDARVAGHSDHLLYPHTHHQLPDMLSDSSLSLLRTSRIIYAEAADIPYASAIFDVDDLHTFTAFSLSVCPQRLQSIKRLTVQWTPVWQPMAGEERKSSIYSHTHNDALWVLFWSRVASLGGLDELRLSLDLGRFSGNAVSGVIGGNRLRLAINEHWVAPILLVRGLKSFDLAITARCDNYAKSVLEGDLCRDAVILRDCLRSVMCSPRGERAAWDAQLRDRCALVSEQYQEQRYSVRPRLAITAS